MEQNRQNVSQTEQEWISTLCAWNGAVLSLCSVAKSDQIKQYLTPTGHYTPHMQTPQNNATRDIYEERQRIGDIAL